jgi:outer membrane lipoprotein-sorting protein
MAKSIFSWAPAAGAIVVVAAAAIAIPMSANASSTLPPKSATQLLEMVASSKVDAFSGTITQTSNLGLPSLPTGEGGGSSSGLASSLSSLTADHSVRIYVDGATKERVQVLGSNEENDVIRNGKDVWVWDFTANTAKHVTLQPKTFRKAHLGAMKQGQLPAKIKAPQTETPAQLANKLISSLSPSSNLSVVPKALPIAGRTAYELVLTPKATDTLVGSVTIAVDSKTGLPLGVDITARGAKTPAFSVEFSKLTLAAPAASMFTFTPPAGAKVTQVTPHAHSHAGAKPSGAKPSTTTAHAKPTVTGKGWDAVATIARQSALTKFESSKQFALLTTSVSGGRLFSTSLVNILFETDGRVLVGSVSAARLEEVAAGS